METILYNISQIVGISILHSLWQGMMVYIVLRIVYAAIPAMPAAGKYHIAIFALAIASFGFIYTLCFEAYRYNWDVPHAAMPALLLQLQFRTANFNSSSLLNRLSIYMPYIFAGYMAGIVLNLLKLNREWKRLYQLKKSLMPAEQMQQFITRLAQRLNISKFVRIHFSERIDVPCVLGYLKPVIILPATLSVHLSACEIKAILLHELAHIKRNDYLVNLLQQLISVILFFNPFIYLINRTISRERENSCDDMVVAKTGNPLIYAQALLKLEQTRNSYLELALAATGKKFHLLNRIERIMKTQKQIGNIRHLLIGIVLLVCSAGSLAWLNPANAGKLKLNILKPNPLKTDTVKYAALTDTPRHRARTVTKSQTRKKEKEFKEYHSKQDSIHFDSLAAFYNSKAWKQQMEAIRKQGDQIRKQFESPEWKKQMQDMKLQALAMQKQFDSPEWKSKMDAIKKKFDSPEWKKQMQDIKLQALAMQKQFDSPEWKSKMEAIKKQFDSPEWKKQMQDMKLQALAMQKHFDSPEWKKQMDAIKRQSEAMQKQFNSPEWKKQMEDLKKMSEKMQQQFNSPEWKKQMEQWQKSGKAWDKMMQDQIWMHDDSVGNNNIHKLPDTSAVKK